MVVTQNVKPTLTRENIYLKSFASLMEKTINETNVIPEPKPQIPIKPAKPDVEPTEPTVEPPQPVVEPSQSTEPIWSPVPPSQPSQPFQPSYVPIPPAKPFISSPNPTYPTTQPHNQPTQIPTPTPIQKADTSPVIPTDKEEH
jgi:hypothetical protein